MRVARAHGWRATLWGVGFVALSATLPMPVLADSPPVAPHLPGQYYRSRAVAKLPDTAPPAAPSVPPAAEAAADMTLADAISLAYRSNPTLEAGRYDLAATDQSLGLALSELRPTSELQVTGQYDRTEAGRLTQKTRFGAKSSIFTRNSLGAQLIVTQPILTGGKASADIAGAEAQIRAGRAGLQASEGDLLLATITAYCDVRRDTRSLAIRAGDLARMRATLDEVHARRKAGELTKTDIAQTETQIQNAETAYNLTRAQQEQGRAAFAALVGVDAGNLAPEPPLPQLPASIDEAFDQALRLNPDLAQARFTEAASRQKIASARAANHPTFSLQGSAGLTGPAVPFYLHNEDQGSVIQGILTIPLTSGGRNAAAIAQAEDTNSGDRLRIEAARRAMVRNIANAWNQMITLQRNLQINEAEVKSGEIFYEGSMAEYRAGLRSTFDVLYAQETLLGAQVALEAARHDLYVAQATLLRHMGVLDVPALTTGIGHYDATADIRRIRQQGATPWDAPVRALDHLEKAGKSTQPGHRSSMQPDVLPETPRLAPPVGPAPPDSIITRSADVSSPTSGPLSAPKPEPKVAP